MSASDVHTALRAAREEYERDFVGVRENLWNGLVSRWNKAETAARQFSKETPAIDPTVIDPDEPDILPPIAPQPTGNGGMLLMLLLLLMSQSRESAMPNEPGNKPDIANVLMLLMLQSMMSGKPLGGDQMLAALLQAMSGKPIAIPPPAPAPTPDPPPATEPPPKPPNPQDAIMALLLQILGGKAAPPVIDNTKPGDTTPPLNKPSVQLSGLGLVLAIGAQLLGFLGTPFGMGSTPTDAGTAAVVIPAMTGLLGSTGIFGSIWNFLKNNVRIGPATQ